MGWARLSAPMKRAWLRLLGVGGVLSGFVLPVTATLSGSVGFVDALFGLEAGTYYTLLDASPLASVVALAVLVLVVTTVLGGTEDDPIEPWFVLAAGTVTLVAVPLVPWAIGQDPTAATSFVGIGAVTAFGGGTLLFGSAVREFHQRVGARWRELLTFGAFGLVLVSLRFPWYRDRSVATGASADPAAYAGTDLVLSSLPVQHLVLACLALYAVLVLLRVRAGIEGWTVGDRWISLEWFLVLPPWLALAVVHSARLPTYDTAAYEPQLHYELSRWALTVAVTAYLVPAVLRVWNQATTDDPQSGDARPTGDDSAVRTPTSGESPGAESGRR